MKDDDKERKKNGFEIFVSLMKEGCDKESRKSWYSGSLTLAGFTLTSLSLIIGFYRTNLNDAMWIISGIIISLFSYFLSYYVAMESETFWQLSFAIFLQYGGTLILMVSFAIFLQNIGMWQSVVYIPIILVIILGLFLLTGAIRFNDFFKKYSVSIKKKVN